MTNILICMRIDPDDLQKIEKLDESISVWYTLDKQEIRHFLPEAEIIFGWIDPELLPMGNKLRWLHLPMSGVDKYIGTGLLPAGVVLTNSKGVFGPSIAEHVFGCILSFTRSIPLCIKNQQQKHWTRVPIQSLVGKVIGIVGFGDIGQQVAKRAKAFDMEVWAIKNNPTETPNDVDYVWDSSKLEQLFQGADYVVVCLPLTAETELIINAQLLHLLKPSAYFINVGRGRLVDERELCKLLQAKRIAGAALDVFWEEPLPRDSGLWELDNLLITPHIAGLTSLHRQQVVELFIENLNLYLENKQLQNQVIASKGY